MNPVPPTALSDAALTDGVLWRRIWAWGIDFVLIAILASVIWVVLLVLGLVTFGLGLVLMALIPAVPLAYHILFVAGRRHATPGQALLGLTVRREGDLGPPSLAQAVVFTGLLWLTLSIGFWPLLAALFTVRHRALHDIAAGVVVVNKEALTLPLGLANMGLR